jgi:hypothetical protein
MEPKYSRRPIASYPKRELLSIGWPSMTSHLTGDGKHRRTGIVQAMATSSQSKAIKVWQAILGPDFFSIAVS